MLEHVIITDEEIAFMRRKCYYMPEWFFTYLRGFRYDARWTHVSQDAAGHLHITVEEQFSPTARQYVVAGNFLLHGREVLFV